MAEEPKEALPNVPESASEPALDAASQSLTNALRISFRILTVVIIVLLAVFVARGFFTVKANHVALVVRLGQIQRTFDSGVHYALPYPIEEVYQIEKGSRELQVDTYWPMVTEKEKEDVISGKAIATTLFAPNAEGGFMLTGDQNLVQSRWKVRYDVDDVVAYFDQIGSPAVEARLVKSIFQNAVVRASAEHGVSDIYPKTESSFVTEVQAIMQQSLAQIQSKGKSFGISIKEAVPLVIVPPQAVKPEFEKVAKAMQERDAEKKTAEAAAAAELIGAAGASGPELGVRIKEWWQIKESLMKAQQQVNALRQTGGTAKAEEILKLDQAVAESAANLQKVDQQIAALLKDVGGTARNALRQAEDYNARVVKEAFDDAQALKQLVAEGGNMDTYKEFMRLDALESVLASAYEKFLFKPAQDGAKQTLDLSLGRRLDIKRVERKVEDTY